MEQTNSFYMYVLLCSDGSLYTGFTTDVQRRFKQHQAGKGAKYTRSHFPEKILFTKAFENEHDALSAEYQFKQLTRKQKIDYLTSHGVQAR